MYGRSSPYFLPHNLYFDLRGGTFSPSIYQFLALSRIAGYRLPDWARLFGADLENIADIAAITQIDSCGFVADRPLCARVPGSETESGTALRLPSRRSVSCCSSLAKRLSSLSESKGRGYRRRGPALTFRLADKEPGAWPSQ